MTTNELTKCGRHCCSAVYARDTQLEITGALGVVSTDHHVHGGLALCHCHGLHALEARAVGAVVVAQADGRAVAGGREREARVVVGQIGAGRGCDDLARGRINTVPGWQRYRNLKGKVSKNYNKDRRRSRKTTPFEPIRTPQNLPDTARGCRVTRRHVRQGPIGAAAYRLATCDGRGRRAG